MNSDSEVIEISAPEMDALATEVALKVFSGVVRRVSLNCPRNLEDKLVRSLKLTGAEVLRQALHKFNKHCDA